MRRHVVAGLLAVIIGVLGAVVLASLHEPTRSAMGFVWSKLLGPYTVEERVAQYRERVARRLAPAFESAGVPYPPSDVAYLAFKDKRVLEVYARAPASQEWRYIKTYQVQGASGVLGPKLVEGDYQVPEGVYKAEFLNPNSRFHLSIRLNYPNEFDREMAKLDGRTRLGGDIMIHGSSSSVGCLAMGDEAAEDLFVLAALVTKERTRIVVSPTDFRASDSEATGQHPAWVSLLYNEIRSELAQFRRRLDVPLEPVVVGGQRPAIHVER